MTQSAARLLRVALCTWLVLVTTPVAAQLPTALGVDHVAITVPEMQPAIEFFVDVIGCEHIYTTGPFKDEKGDWMRTNIGVDPRASVLIAMVRCGATQNVELFEYTVADQDKVPPRNSDIGGNHICFYVRDIEKAVAYLQAVPGVRVMGEPTKMGPPAALGGITFVYFETPWGSVMELISYETGMHYETVTEKRLFDIREAARK